MRHYGSIGSLAILRMTPQKIRNAMNTKELDRYPHDWTARSLATKQSRQQGNKVQCSCCRRFWPCDGVEVHHTSYEGENDRAGINIFPVCGSKQDVGTCHHWLHEKSRWIKDKNYWFNRNTNAIVRRLQDSYAQSATPSDNTTATMSAPIVEESPWLGIAATIGAITIGLLLLNPFSRVQPQKITAIVETTVNVRQGPGASYPKSGEPLIMGTTVEVLEEKDGWIRVGDQKWIAKNYTKKYPTSR